MSRAPEAPVLLVEYDPAWPAAFEREREALALVLGIMAGVESLEASLPAIQPVSRLDYVHHPYRAEVMHWFCKPSPAHRTHHLHLVPLGSALWNERLLFRDVLRRDRALAAEYAELKTLLAHRYRNDREAYTEAKSDFVVRVLTEGQDSP